MNRLAMASVLAVTLVGASPEALARADSNIKVEDCAQMMKAVMPLPMKFGELMTAVADGLSSHAAWVGSSKDKNAKAEAASLKKLAKQHQAVAGQMKKIVSELEKASTLAPAPHDMSKMDPKSGDMMLKQAALEREMAQLMIKHADDTEKMVKAMAQAPAAMPAHAPAAKK